MTKKLKPKKLKHWFIIYAKIENEITTAELRGITRADDAWKAFEKAKIVASKKDGDWIIYDMKPLD